MKPEELRNLRESVERVLAEKIVERYREKHERSVEQYKAYIGRWYKFNKKEFTKITGLSDTGPIFLLNATVVRLNYTGIYLSEATFTIKHVARGKLGRQIDWDTFRVALRKYYYKIRNVLKDGENTQDNDKGK